MTDTNVKIRLVPFLIPTWAAGQAWPNTILIKRGQVSVSLVAHELVHIDQWREHGLLFSLKYLLASRRGYWLNPYEVEARQKQHYTAYLERARALIERSGS